MDGQLKWSDAKKLLACKLHEQGYSAEEIATIVDAGVSSVFRWIQRANNMVLTASFVLTKNGLKSSPPNSLSNSLQLWTQVPLNTATNLTIGALRFFAK